MLFRRACIKLLFIFFICTSVSSETYDTKYDKINVDAVLKNERILKRYLDCLMDRASCTGDAKLLKMILPEALKTECAKCSQQQKVIAGKVLAYLLQYKKDYWEELTAKYDPDGNIRKTHGYGEEPENIDYSQYDED